MTGRNASKQTKLVMNKQERLRIYKKALSDYRKAYHFGWLFLDKKSVTSRGFCYYFGVLIFNELLELQSLDPEAGPLNVEGDWLNYWFMPGDRLPRIELLKKAIKLAKYENDNHSTV